MPCYTMPGISHEQRDAYLSLRGGRGGQALAASTLLPGVSLVALTDSGL